MDLRGVHIRVKWRERPRGLVNFSFRCCPWNAPSNVKRFGTFEVDLRARELRKGGIRIRLQDQPFEILAVMLERPGEVVTREELRQRLWPAGTFVDFEHSLNAAIKRLRAALGDDADNPRFVETLHRRGYRFIAAVESEGQPIAQPARGAPPCHEAARRQRQRAARRAAVREPEQRSGAGIFQRRADRGDDHADRPAVPGPARRHRADVVDAVQAVGKERQRDRPRAVGGLPSRRQRPRRRRSRPHHRAAHRDPHGSASLGRDLRPFARRNAESADRRRRAHRPIARDGARARSGRRAGSVDAAPDRGVSGIPQGPVSLESRQPRRRARPRFRTTSARSISIPILRRRMRRWLARASRSRITRESRAARSSSRRRRRHFGRSRSIPEFPMRMSPSRKSGARSNGTGGRPRTNTEPPSRCRRAARSAHRFFAQFLAAMSRFGEAKAEADRACDVDPFCLRRDDERGVGAICGGRVRRGHRSQPARARHGCRLHAGAAICSARRCSAPGRPDEAVVELAAAAGPGGDDPHFARVARPRQGAGRRSGRGAARSSPARSDGARLCAGLSSRARAHRARQSRCGVRAARARVRRSRACGGQPGRRAAVRAAAPRPSLRRPAAAAATASVVADSSPVV